MAQRTEPPAFTVSADLLSGLIDCAVQCGMPRSAFDTVLQDESGQHVSGTRYAGGYILKLWERILRLSQDPIIGFRMAQSAGVKTFGVLGQILPRCATLLDAYRQTERFSALASQGGHMNVSHDASSLIASVDFDVPEGPIKHTIIYWGLTNLSLLPQRLAGVTAVPRGVECAFPSPGPVAARALRERLPFTFDATRNCVIFDRRVGELMIPSADADLKKLLAEVMEQHLEKLGSNKSFAHGLKTILRQMMNGTMPTLASLSARAGMSQRTLQRRLSEGDTSFQELLQDVLRESAETLLAQGNLSQGEIAFLLGYSEVSAFSRAYRSWTGHPPGAAHA